VSGKLIRNVLVMYDRATGSLWSQLLGKAVEGPRKDQELEYLPSWQTTWADWKARHPETQALQKGYSGIRDPYTSYYQSQSAGVIGETFSDGRLYVKEFVIGVELDGNAVAYPFSVLNDEPVVNAEVSGKPLLVVFDTETASGVVYSRVLDGQVLTFTQVGNELRLVDGQTGSTWNGLDGEAIDGPLAGRSLDRIKSTRSFWFGWKDFYPDTRVYGIDQP
jgi:hypothetical protein